MRVPSIYVLNKISNADVGAASITGTVEMAANDYLELWVEDLNDDGYCETNAMSFIAK